MDAEKNLEKLVERQRAYFAEGKTLSVDMRLQALERLEKALREGEEELCRALKADLGKSRIESYMCEVGLTLSELGYVRRHLRSWSRNKRVRTPLAQFHARSFTVQEPYGVVLVMSPWNYPVLLTLEPLIGEAIDPDVYREIKQFVERYDGIEGTHDLIVHNYGPSRSMASIHAEVPNDCDVERTHEIIDRIEREAMRRMGILLVIHMDPVETHDERVVEFKELVTSVLDGIDSRLTFHDFRMVDGVERINLIFDLVVPREYKPSVLGKLKARISDEVKKRDGRCECVITVENSFMSGNKE